MTHDARERSRADGKPIRLYEFGRGAMRWLYCSADRDIVHGGRIYAARAVSDDGIRQAGELSADALVVTAPWDIDVVRQFRGMPPSVEISLTVRDMHYGETDAAVVWVGSIAGVKWPAPNKCEISCQPLAASFERSGLTRTWERNCPYTLFDTDCTVDRNQYKTAITVQSLTGAAIQAGALAAQPDGYFSGGFVEWDIGDGEVERRGIESHAGSTAALLGGTDGLVIGQALTAYPGCGRTIAICQDKFGNAVNYGGIPHLPGKSPFDGTPIF